MALFTGASITAATAASGSTQTLRAQVDAIGARYLAAQEQARALDSQLQAIDQQLARDERRSAQLLPQAKAQAVALYQSGSQGFTVLFDTTSAMESARRAELLALAGDHTQALIEQYANAAANVQLRRVQIAATRAKQAALVASLAQQERTLEQALARAQQIYQEQVAAAARAKAAATSTTTGAPAQAPTTTNPPAPAQPVHVTPPAPPESGANPHHDDPFLVCTRTRESSGYYGAVNPGGYYGAYQFSPPTWDLTAVHAGMPQLIGVRPDQASAWDQDQLAWVLYQWRGNAPWGGLC
jgi:hypothetical protein